MLERWLTFGLSAEQEDRFRRASFQQDVAQARICILLVLVPLLVFAINDYRFLGPSWRFQGLTALRLAMAAYSVVLVGRLRRLTSYRSYDREEFIWGLCFAVFIVLVASTRSQAYVAHAIIAVVAVFVSVIAIPNRFANQLVLSVIYPVGETVIIGQGSLRSQPAFVSVGVSVWLASFIAVAVARWLHSLRRREFLAREGEREAKAEAEKLLAARVETEAALRTAFAANEKLVAELRESLDNVKTLSGLLPICMHCKNVRNDKGYWEQIERYLSSRTDALFSHALYPDCLKKHYPEAIRLEEKELNKG